MSWLRRVFRMCDHQYVKTNYGTYKNLFLGDYLSTTYWSVWECQKCGKAKKREVTV